MPDITMCANSACILRHKCFRHSAKPSMMQSYSMFKPDRIVMKRGDIEDVIYDCEHFVDNALYSPNQINLQHGKIGNRNRM